MARPGQRVHVLLGLLLGFDSGKLLCLLLIWIDLLDRAGISCSFLSTSLDVILVGFGGGATVTHCFWFSWRINLEELMWRRLVKILLLTDSAVSWNLGLTKIFGVRIKKIIFFYYYLIYSFKNFSTHTQASTVIQSVLCSIFWSLSKIVENNSIVVFRVDDL